MDPAVLEKWRQLNATERYFALLETWLMLANEDVIGERGGSVLDLDSRKFALVFHSLIQAAKVAVSGSLSDSCLSSSNFVKSRVGILWDKFISC